MIIRRERTRSSYLLTRTGFGTVLRMFEFFQSNHGAFNYLEMGIMHRITIAAPSLSYVDMIMRSNNTLN
jgi:hypothetical protein